MGRIFLVHEIILKGAVKLRPQPAGECGGEVAKWPLKAIKASEKR